MMRDAKYNEAGHAVAAYHHGMQITGVSVTEEECVTNFPRPLYGGWSDAWRQAVIILAGQFADQRALWGEIRPDSFEEFLANAQEERGLVELDEETIAGDHVGLLEAWRRWPAIRWAASRRATG
jgi:hypothetical protein